MISILELYDGVSVYRIKVAKFMMGRIEDFFFGKNLFRDDLSWEKVL